MRTLCVALGLVLALNAGVAASEATGHVDPKLSGGVELGYYGGPGFQAFVMLSDFAEKFPMNFRLAVGFTSVQPGIATDARRVFINDATNGTPEESGRQTDFRFDLLYPVKLLNMPRAYVFGGPRHVRFVGNFKYIGGNEDFDVTSNQWGIGAGLETYFAMSRKLDLVFQVGADYYLESTLTGHDTKYSPDGDNANGRDGYSYDDADEAIDQPTFEPRLMMGVVYNF